MLGGQWGARVWPCFSPSLTGARPCLHRNERHCVDEREPSNLVRFRHPSAIGEDLYRSHRVASPSWRSLDCRTRSLCYLRSSVASLARRCPRDLPTERLRGSHHPHRLAFPKHSTSAPQATARQFDRQPRPPHRNLLRRGSLLPKDERFDAP